MDSSTVLSRQGRRLLQMGVGLFLFTSFEGFGIPYLAAPRLGLSLHTLTALQGVMFLALGLLDRPPKRQRRRAGGPFPGRHADPLDVQRNHARLMSLARRTAGTRRQNVAASGRIPRPAG